MEPSDHELMLAVRAGELRKLGDLFERHHRALYGFFVRLTQDRDASEDLVQMVFYRILKYRHTYRDEGKFSAWVYHLARKIAADHFHSRRARATLPADADESPWENLPDQAPAPDARAATADDLSLLERAMGELSTEQRELLVLARFQGLSQEEIARLFDTTVGAVKVRVHRAFVALRDRYFRLRRTPLA
ncbi:MAG TPA: RNA polymerase sigma factor [Opitutaceae bacterium]|nr:RNA polymerase sigma factor [Opitutaceae bacterium]